MKTYVALLRGINVGGKNSLPMKSLKALLEGLQAENVATYIQSGNAIFRHKTRSAQQLAAKISDAIEKTHGFAPPTVLITSSELEQAIRGNPFPNAEETPTALHLFFLDQTPENANLERLEQLASPTEKFHLQGKVLYLYAPDGTARSKLAAQAEKSLGVIATARNWRTVQKLRAMVDALG